ncbi:uncharacterized protein CTHT_0039810 [Thermochaetoides thermophila DSM 1495]|uniref:Uncharacterized protein n=1 Tax=Chaetomium thermophilum (strain DSM 1495 / CBS 144.50 / IMI 039719) TaxID=759272 RepID=G0S4D7_CHATD|nr:hypothetical protein CTHT_0039810 [Thermochaetoides thermophila DSM 1495]EGS22095.1 hypothetical protein CTHT_0039810 [Thermochaetoides thermophila DSM 1495]
MYPPPPAPASFASREELEQFAWAVYDVLAGVAGRFSIRPGKHNKSASWWSEGLATARETNPVVYRKLCKEARVNFYKERISTATSSAEWGRILRWRKDAPDNRPMVMIVDGRVVSDTEQVAAYLATQAFRPAGAQEGPRPAWLGPRLPLEWPTRLAAPLSDEELKDAFFGALVNQLCTKARGLGLKVDPNKTEVLYILPRGTGARRGRIDPTTISTQVERTSFLPANPKIFDAVVTPSVTWTRQSKERDVPDCQHEGHQRQDDCERHKYVVDPGRCLEPDDRRE